MVDGLVQAIGYRRTELVEIKAGDAAVDEGLAGKAAAAYQRAWQAGSLNPAIGMKAANLFAGRLNDPLSAARISRQIVSKFPDSEPGGEAANLLARLGPSLRKAADELYQEAWQAKGDRKKELFLRSIEADPNHFESYYRLAEIAAESGDEYSMYSALKELTKRGMLKTGYLAADDVYGKYLHDATFQKFIGESLGQQELQSLIGLVDEQQKRRDSEKAKDRAQFEADRARINEAFERIEKNNARAWDCRYYVGSRKGGTIVIQYTPDSGLICSGEFRQKQSGGEVVTGKITRVIDAQLTSMGGERLDRGVALLEINEGRLDLFEVNALLEGQFKWKDGSGARASTWAILRLTWKAERPPYILVPSSDLSWATKIFGGEVPDASQLKGYSLGVGFDD